MAPLSVVYRNLAAYHRAGASWPDAVEGSAPRESWRPVADALRRGARPSEALAPVVPGIDVAGLRAAEASGRMEEALDSLSAMHAAEEARRRQRRAALAYPVALAHVGALLLPFPDLFRGRVGAAIGWAALALLPVYGFLAAAALSRRGRLPPSRAGVEEADARALRALGWLHDAGVPFPEALPLAARAGAGGRVAADLGRAAGEVARGAPLAGAWRETPDDVRSRLVAGEATGTLSRALRETSETLDDVADARRRRFAALLGPAVVLMIGAVVAWRVISFYGGLYSNLPG